MKTRQISCLRKSILPILYLMIIALLLVFSQCSTVTLSLLPHVWRVNMVENRNNNNVVIFISVTTLHYFNEFFQAPCWRCVVLREYNKKQSWFIDCFLKFWPNFISFLDPVVYIGMDIVSAQSFIEMTCETSASIFASKADENIIFFQRCVLRGGWRRRSHGHVCMCVFIEIEIEWERDPWLNSRECVWTILLQWNTYGVYFSRRTKHFLSNACGRSWEEEANDILFVIFSLLKHGVYFRGYYLYFTTKSAFYLQNQSPCLLGPTKFDNCIHLRL